MERQRDPKYDCPPFSLGLGLRPVYPCVQTGYFIIGGASTHLDIYCDPVRHALTVDIQIFPIRSSYAMLDGAHFEQRITASTQAELPQHIAIMECLIEKAFLNYKPLDCDQLIDVKQIVHRLLLLTNIPYAKIFEAMERDCRRQGH
jgi:hypothetical protein